EGPAELLDPWHLTADGLRQGDAAKKRRMQNQARFLAEQQRSFYQSTTDFLRKDLGYGGLIAASNWMTADPPLEDAIERYTYSPAGTMDQHGYFSGKHEGEGAGWSVRVGQTFSSLSVLNAPHRFPLRIVQVD